MMYCFDTNILIDIFRGEEYLKNKIVDLFDSGNVFITPTTLCELYKGANLHNSPEEKIKQVDEFVSFFKILNFNLASCKEYGKLYKKLKSKGKIMNDFDIMIAALVKTNNLILITRDKHFKELNINVEVW